MNACDTHHHLTNQKVDKDKVDKNKVDKDKVDKDNVDKDKEDKDKVGQLNPVATRLCNLETMKWHDKHFFIKLYGIRLANIRWSHVSSHTGNLKTHLRNHSEENTHKCNQCDYASSDTGHIVAFMRFF